MQDFAGQVIGDYQILHQIGAGGSAVVYKAYSNRLSTEVAFKIIRSEALQSQAASRLVQRFQREAQVLTRLDHPHIVKILDTGEYQGCPFIVMPFLSGGTLKQALGKTMPYREAALLLAPVARALEYAHRKNVVHRDVKPSNILLTQTGQPMLTDFGVAKLLAADRQASLTIRGHGVGTPEYMAPEQWAGQSTPASDQYSLGIVFYELITGSKPFTADTPAALLQKKIHDPLPPAVQAVPDLPAAVEKVLVRATEKRPADRFPDMGVFAAALETLGETVQAAPLDAPTVRISAMNEPGIKPFPESPVPVQVKPTDAEPEKAARFARPRTWILAAAGLILGVLACLVVTGLVGTRYLNNRSTLATTPAPVWTPVAAGNLAPSPIPLTAVPVKSEVTPGNQAPGGGASPDVGSSPTAGADSGGPALAPGSLGRIAFVSDRSDGKTLQIWTMDLSSQEGRVQAGNFTQLTSDRGDKRAPAWSPDGQKLLYSAPGTEETGLDIWMIDLKAPDSSPVNLTQLKGDDTTPAWSPDGSLIGFTNTGRYVDGIQALYTVLPDGSGRKRISEDYAEHSPFWSPDMKWLMYVIFARDHNYLFRRSQAFDYSTPEPFDPVEIFGRLGEVADPAISPDGSTIAYTRVDGLNHSICLVDVQSRGGKVSPLDPRQTRDFDPTWSPDGRMLAFSSDRDRDSEIYLSNQDGSGQTNLTRSEGRDLDPAWQP